MSDLIFSPQSTLYLDESGDHRYDQLNDISSRYLCLLGVVFDIQNDYLECDSKLNELKNKYWPGRNPDNPVILHRADIIGKNGPFGILKDASIQKQFDEDLLRWLIDSKFTIINVTLDKKAHLNQYVSAAHPYNYCLHALLERYVFWLSERNKKGDVIAESRGKEDRSLKHAYIGIYRNGTSFRNGKDFFQKYLTSGEIKIKPKRANLTGLQVADLMAYPFREKILYEKKIRSTKFLGTYNEVIVTNLKAKLRKSGSGIVSGYGEVFL